jgi:hypothetical protein
MKVMFWKLNLLISLVLFVLSGQAQKHFEASYELTTNLPKNFIAAEQERLYELQAKYIAIERTFGTFIESNSTLSIVDDGKYISEIQFKANAESKVSGTWIKDITPPEVTYTKKGKEKWITVKVHGYVAKRPNKTEARELLLKQLSAKPLMEDVQVHSIEYYPNDFVISIVVLDSTNYKSHSEMHRVANILAKRQVLTYFSGSKIEDVFIYKTTADGKFEISKDNDSQNTYSAVKESSSGWVNAIESLDKIKIKGTNEWAFIFLKEIENL